MIITERELQQIDFWKLTPQQRLEVNQLLKELEERKLKYPILDFHPQSYQQEFVDALAMRNPDWTPRWKFIVFLWGNGSWKTVTCAYLTILMAMGEEVKKYWLPYV